MVLIPPCCLHGSFVESYVASFIVVHHRVEAGTFRVVRTPRFLFVRVHGLGKLQCCCFPAGVLCSYPNDECIYVKLYEVDRFYGERCVFARDTAQTSRSGVTQDQLHRRLEKRSQLVLFFSLGHGL